MGCVATAYSVWGRSVQAETGAFCRIAVAGPRTRADLAVPAGIPLAHLLPTLLRHAADGGGDDGGVGHGGWAVSRTDGSRLDAALSLAGSGIHDGDVLVLHPARDRTPPPLYDDVVEVIGAGGVHTAWESAHTRLACGVVAAIAVLSATAAVAFNGSQVGGYLALVAAVLLLLGGGALARAAGDLPAGILTSALAAPVGAVGAGVLLGGDWGRGHLLLASAVFLLVAGLGPVVVGGGDAIFAALGVLGLSGLLGGLVAVIGEVGPGRAAAVVAPLALAVTTVMPTLALRAARLPRPVLPRSAEDLADLPGQVELERTQQRVARARQLFTGLIAGCHAAVGIGIALLAFDVSLWSAVLAAVLTILVVLRSRLFRERAQVLAPVVTVAFVFVAGTGAAVTHFAADITAMLGIAAPVLVGLALLTGLIGVSSGRRPANPRLVRLLDMTETFLLLAVVPLVLAVWDVYGALLDLHA
jgi:type VII secretion integral membrane protein EccD